MSKLIGNPDYPKYWIEIDTSEAFYGWLLESHDGVCMEPVCKLTPEELDQVYQRSGIKRP